MAGTREANQARVTPEAVAAWVELALFLADRILRLFGRRKSDVPDRERGSVRPAGPGDEPPR
jgi:hypothetical protein